MKNTADLSLAEKVSKFNQLEESFKEKLDLLDKFEENSYKTIFNLVFDAVKLKDQIELELAKTAPSNLQMHDPKLRDTISLIRDGHQFITTYAYELFTKKDDDSSFGDDNYHFDFDTLLDHFMSWFDVPTYYRAKLTVGPIVTSKSLPDKLSTYFAELRDAYAYGLDKSCRALCRALLELCLTDKLSQILAYNLKLKEYRKRKKKPEWDFDLYTKISHAYENELFDSDLKILADSIRNSGNETLHAFSNKKLDPQKNDLEIIKDTVKIVEHLYN